MLPELYAFAHATALRIADRFPFLRSVEHGSVKSYLLTLALMGLALWVRLAIAPVSAGLQYVTFFPAVTLAAIFAGYRGGLLATACGLVFATYIFTPPYYSISLAVLQTSLWSNMVFLADGIIMSVAIESMHRYRWRHALELAESKRAHASLMEYATALQQAQVALEQFKFTVDHTKDGVFIFQPDTLRFIYTNHGAQRQVGYDEAELLQMTPLDIEPSFSERQFRAKLQPLLDGDLKASSLQAVYRHKDGHDIPVDIVLQLVQGENLAPRFVAFSRDIAERRKIESELRIAAAAFESQEGIMVTDADTVIQRVNRAYTETTGYRADELIGRKPSMVQSGRHGAAFYEAMWESIQRTGSWDGEIWNRHKDGGIFPKWLTITAVKGDDGRVTHYVGTEIDIAARKKADEDLQLAASVFHNSAEGVVITDADSVILSVNPAFEEITGYAEDEVLGRKPSLLRSDRHGAEFYRAMWASLLAEGSWKGEIWNRRKNGEAYLEWLTINRITDSTGATIRYVSVFHDITELRRKDEHIRHQAFHDALTGLPNRALFQERLQHALDRLRREGGRLSVTFIDLDGFKGVNDTLGHDVGDALLQEVAKRIRARMRRGVDTVARLGGDEFVVLIEDLQDADVCASLADKIIADLSRPFELGAQEIRVGASMGMAFYPEDGDSVQALMKCADTAMYAAKAAGKGTYRFFQAGMLQAVTARLTLEAELRTALKLRQFVLHYQPQLDLRSGRIVGVEALVRWQHPEKGLVSPLEFIPVAEECGLIVALGDWVLEEACRQLAQWRASGLDDIRVSVNLSASQFADPGLPLRIEKVLEKTGTPASCLDLEVTESTTMNEPADAAAMMRVLAAQKLTLSIDDFGTGYSSLAYLKMFPISTLKIDQAFVKDIETDPDDAGICDVTVLLAHKLGLDVVAEGVETAGQLKFLLSIGCEKVQGYLISRPLPGDQAEAFMRNNLPLTGLGTIDLWDGATPV